MAKAKKKPQAKPAKKAQKGNPKANVSSVADEPSAPHVFTPSPTSGRGRGTPRRRAEASASGSALLETPQRRSAAPPPQNLQVSEGRQIASGSARRSQSSGSNSREESPERRRAPSRSSQPAPSGRQNATGSRRRAEAIASLSDASASSEAESPESPGSSPRSPLNRQNLAAPLARAPPAQPAPTGRIPRQPLPSKRGGKRTTKAPRYRPPPKYLLEINRLQKSTDLMIPAAAFCRLVREVTISVTRHNDIRYQKVALMALHEAAEAYIVGMFEDSYLCALHCKRVTLQAKDMRLAYRIRGDAKRYGL